MQFAKRPTSTRAAQVNRVVESVANRAVRVKDGLLSATRLGGRKAAYDDLHYEFEGGPGAEIQRKHYEKSLRLLWKAEADAPWTGHRDCTRMERELQDAAYRVMDDEEKDALKRLGTEEFKAMLKREYTQREREAMVAILAGIGHGEAYAWLVSAELLGEVQSTGARAALSCQVLEEAKHFLVLRELLRAFDVEIPRQSAWEYVLMEDVLKAGPLDKLFGMNIVIESIALSFFGLVSNWPGMEIIRLFHRDEARHAAMPSNYLASFPLPDKEQNSLRAQIKRLKMVIPAIALIPHIEEDMAELGVDAFEFGGSVIRRIATLSERNGYRFPVSNEKLLLLLEAGFNAYCKVTRDDHELCRFMEANLTMGVEERAAEVELFGA
jgi:hypothetical protein